MDGAERRVAVADGVHQDADAHQVVDLREVTAADDHILVDAVVVLGAAGDGRLDARRAQILLDLVGDDGQVLVALGRALGDQADDLVVHLGVEDREGEVLQLPLDGVHAQPVGERRVDLQGLARLLLLLLALEVAHGAHVVQAVGELDDQDARVLGHGDDHLAHGLGLRRLAELDLVQLGDTVDEQGDHVAEVAAQVLQAVLGVLDGVVQQPGHQGGRIHAQLGEDGSDGERVRDVRVAALALLAAVPAFGDLVGALDLAQGRRLDLRVVAAHYAQQRLQDRVVRVGALHAEAGEAGADAVGGAGAGGLPGWGADHGRVLRAFGRQRLGARLLLRRLVDRCGRGVLDGSARVVLRLGPARRGLRRGRRGGLGLCGGQWLGLVWQEDSSCAIRVPRSGSAYPMVAILPSRIAFWPM
ncbi:hypothetical protein SVIOM342S_07310 [Streptomyces violaceorubidus]